MSDKRIVKKSQILYNCELLDVMTNNNITNPLKLSIRNVLKLQFIIIYDKSLDIKCDLIRYQSCLYRFRLISMYYI